jgi:hypothetical protein
MGYVHFHTSIENDGVIVVFIQTKKLKSKPEFPLVESMIVLGHTHRQNAETVIFSHWLRDFLEGMSPIV